MNENQRALRHLAFKKTNTKKASRHEPTFGCDEILAASERPADSAPWVLQDQRWPPDLSRLVFYGIVNRGASEALKDQQKPNCHRQKPTTKKHPSEQTKRSGAFLGSVVVCLQYGLLKTHQLSGHV